MSLRYKQLTEITEADLHDLVQNATAEGREIEYKVQLPGNGEGEKREFLYDVSSFANCIGGDLIFGIAAKRGVPSSLPGIVTADIDATKLRLENLIRDVIQPRITPGVTIHPVSLANSNWRRRVFQFDA